jgi:hypothetical protein
MDFLPLIPDAWRRVNAMPASSPSVLIIPEWRSKFMTVVV